ncbi:DUF4174 domain-containing protein [Vannielia litorea]|nr:DUF4174 domain-containing protein [Vannielia litorea]
MAVGLGGGAGAQELVQSLASEANALKVYRWQNRPVLLFADNPEDAQYRIAVEALRGAFDGLAERDIVVLTDTDPASPSALRTRLAPMGFAMYLVGKDGGIKLRSDTPIRVETLFETIDSMPMRQREMRED